jgi:hypothetical protein
LSTTANGDDGHPIDNPHGVHRSGGTSTYALDRGSPLD